MKITKTRLKRIIKEELTRVLREFNEEELEDGPFVVMIAGSEDEDGYYESSYEFFDSAGKRQGGDMYDMRDNSYDMATAMRVREMAKKQLEPGEKLELYDFGAGHEVAFEDDPYDAGIVDSYGNPIKDMGARF